MNRFSHAFSILVAVLLLAFASPGYSQTFYPDAGDLYYDGSFCFDSYFGWSNPGGWLTADPGYEHDLLLWPDYFTACTSWTTLPDGYDDCPTAGILDFDMWAFSFGSYAAKKIQPQTWYYGAWSFSGGSLSSSKMRLNGQETAHDICPWDSPWCMDGKRSWNLLDGWVYFGVEAFEEW